MDNYQKHEEGKLKERSSILSPVSTPSSSSSTSPSREFSFTISLHSSSNSVSDYKTKNPSSIAIDLSPADDIFFHGHLLPLHLLSHLPLSSPSSTNSSESFDVPRKELLDDPKPISKTDSNIRNHERVSHAIEGQVKNKSKSFSLFSLKRRQKEGVNVRETEERENPKEKMRFGVSHVLKRYMRMIRPLLFFRRKREKLHINRQAYSFSSNLSSRNERLELKGRKGDNYSALVSIRTSPTNSGLLVATTRFPSSTSDNTIEELQVAIQKTITHCKNSIKGEEKLKC